MYPLTKVSRNAPASAEAPLTRPAQKSYLDDFSLGNSENAMRFQEHIVERETPCVREAYDPGELQKTERRERDFLLKLAYDLGADHVVVSETYSPPSVTEAAGKLRNLGIAPGFALDLTTTDERGIAWDFSIAERRQAARALFHKTKPMFLVGSPPCTRFCSWQAINDKRRDPAVVAREHIAAMVHI